MGSSHSSMKSRSPYLFSIKSSHTKWFIISVTIILIGSCKNDTEIVPSEPEPAFLSKDKAMYAPGEMVQLTLLADNAEGFRIRYKHLNNVLGDISYQGERWSWQPPPENHKGYMIEVYAAGDQEEKILATIAVDVSSQWSRFPRYGFLSDFSSTASKEKVIGYLNRLHINGILFYDWANSYQNPIKTNNSIVEPVWHNIAGREVSKDIIAEYLALARARNMTTFYHNYAYAATDRAYEDQVSVSWHLFRDSSRQQIDMVELPSPSLTTKLMLMNPASLGWQLYIERRNAEIFQTFDFDGWHIDQFGDRGLVYDFHGNLVPLESDFKPFTDFLKDQNPDKRLIFNAHNQFGQYALSHSPVDILFTTVKPPHIFYSDLGRFILNNNAFSNNTKQSVLAAAMNTEVPTQRSKLNTPAILFTQAVISAFGASLFSVGEHFISDTYLPNARLEMSSELSKSLISYYDFLVAYQNLLRGEGTFNRPAILVVNRTCCVNHWPPQAGNIALIGKESENRQVIHMINFMDTESLDWADSSGQKEIPIRQNNLTIVHSTPRHVKKVWYASPDLNYGSAMELSFRQTDNQVVFTIPSLKYWSMMVVDY